MQVDIFFDPVCPWCYIGKRRLEQAMELRSAIDLNRNWRPFLLNPEIPDEGLDRTAYLIRKYGSEQRVRRTFGAIADAGQSVEIDFGFERISRTPSTINAHRLVRYAGDFEKADAVVEALFLNYFINGVNIGETAVLASIATDAGLDKDQCVDFLEKSDGITRIYEENARAHRAGINGVPSFIFSGGLAISGAQEPEVLAKLMDAATVAESAA